MAGIPLAEKRNAFRFTSQKMAGFLARQFERETDIWMTG